MSENRDTIYEFQQFIGDSSALLKYLHNTSEREVAETIMREGFQYRGYLENTSDFISGVDLIQLKYFRQIRGIYGNFTVVLQIAKKLADIYTEKLKDSPFHFTEVLIKEEPFENNDCEMVYTLPPQYVKGYFIQDTGEVVKNPVFDPYFDPPGYDQNVEKLLNEM